MFISHLRPQGRTSSRPPSRTHFKPFSMTWGWGVQGRKVLICLRFLTHRGTTAAEREKVNAFAGKPIENCHNPTGEGSRTPPLPAVRVPAQAVGSQVTGWSGLGEEGSKVKELEILSLPDFLQGGSLQTLQTPAPLFYKLTFGRRGRASTPWGCSNDQGRTQSRAVGS